MSVAMTQLNNNTSSFLIVTPLVLFSFPKKHSISMMIFLPTHIPTNVHYSAEASYCAACRRIRDTKILCLSVEGLSVESGTYDENCQLCTVKCMVVESEELKAQNCALSKFRLPMHSNVPYFFQK